jgi:arylformamidase
MTDPSPLVATERLLAFQTPADLDDAYENRIHIPDADRHLAAWPKDAATFRRSFAGTDLNLAYGSSKRTHYDLFTPKGGIEAACGLAAFVHGGYWLALSKDDFSHMAAGLLARGWAVAILGYTLAPQARITQITQEISTAVEHLGKTGTGPLRLIGHSAGGHLVSRMMCDDITFGPVTTQRLDRVLSVSGLHDLRPLQRLAKNDLWQLDNNESHAESPLLRTPRPGLDLVCFAGADERPEFIRQNAILPLAWQGLGANCHSQLLAGHNHFTIIETMTQPDSRLCELVDGPLA